MQRWNHKLWIVLCLCTLFLVALSACGKKDDANNAENAVSTPAFSYDPNALAADEGRIAAAENTESEIFAQDEPQATQVAQEQSAFVAQSATLEVTQTVCSYFPKLNGFSQLYGAVEFKNNSSETAYVSNASLQFSVGDKAFATQFVPMLNTDDWVAPGETSTIAYWGAFDASTVGDIDTDSLTLTATLEGQTVDPSQIDRRLAVNNLSLQQNYPSFATLTGSVTNPTDMSFALSLVYANFYDADGKLLGVWHFTGTTAAPEDSTRVFSDHLKTFPVEGLAENTVTVTGRAIGID